MKTLVQIVMKPWSLVVSVMMSWILVLNVSGCATPEGEFLSTGGHILLTVSGLANHLAIAAYDLDEGTPRGRYITDFRGDGNDVIRGLAAFSPTHFLAVGSTTNTMYKIGYDGANDAFLAITAGATYDAAISPDGSTIWVVLANTVQSYSLSGVPGLAVGGALAPCAALNGPRSIDFTSDGKLVVVSATANTVNIYTNPATSSPTCATAALAGTTPYGVVVHSDGNIYYTRQAATAGVLRTTIAGATPTIIFQNATYITAPTSIVEHPSGDLLVASTTNTIERLTNVNCTPAPNCAIRVGTSPFIRDTFSNTIQDMVVIRKEDGSEK